MARIDGEKVRCERCEYTEDLEWHHKIYRSDEGSDDPSNLEVLCRDCHHREHLERGDFAEFGKKGGEAAQLRLQVMLGQARYAQRMRALAFRRWGRA